ncbi:MAG: HD domain-containing protein [Cyclobacteriaceae bacterium]
MTDLSPQIITDQIFGLYHRYGNESYGESVTQTEHMVQSAQLAEKQGYDDEIILSAFFHDIGHFLEHEPAERMGELGAQQHDKLGGDYLRQRGFSEKIAQLVESHVAAKRYLTFRYPDYYETLSDASKQTLKYQGGPMTAEEALKFEQDELFDLKIKMRQWDDEAKIPDRPVKNLDRYRQLCQAYLERAERN